MIIITSIAVLTVLVLTCAGLVTPILWRVLAESP
jgi:hypothetical protein